MRRIAVSVGILLLLAALSLAHVSRLRGLTEELDGLLAQAGESVEREDWAGAEALTRRALEKWEENDFYLHATLRHSEVDAVLCAFHETLAFLQGEERQPAEYAAANARLRVQIRLLAEEELPTPQNML